MGNTLRFHPDVASDIADAIAWYEDRSTGLGDRFRAVVDARLDDILASPGLFPLAFDGLDIHFARLPRFPYLKLFQIRGETIVTGGIFHSASNPEKWRHRST